MSKNSFWRIENPIILFVIGVLLLATGPLAGLIVFSYAWDKPDFLPVAGWTQDVAVMLVQAHLYYSLAAIVIGPGLIVYAFIRLVVIIVKKLKATKQ